jgi:hypothetical protein
MKPTNEWSMTPTLGYAHTLAALTRLFGLHMLLCGGTHSATPRRNFTGLVAAICKPLRFAFGRML